jgi:hypothetical protein
MLDAVEKSTVPPNMVRFDPLRFEVDIVFIETWDGNTIDDADLNETKPDANKFD